jgi:hypothetical protein
MGMSCTTEPSELQSMLPVKCLPLPGEKQYHLELCHATSGAHIEISEVYKKLVRSNV